jgi:hypothetical protein
VPSAPLYRRKVQENALKAAEVRVNGSVDLKSKRKKIRSKSGGDRTPRQVLVVGSVVVYFAVLVQFYQVSVPAAVNSDKRRDYQVQVQLQLQLQLQLSELKAAGIIDVEMQGKVDWSRNGGVRRRRLYLYICSSVVV